MFYGYGMSITLRYTDTREQAVTVLNDSFLKVFDQIKKFDTERPFKPWLRTVIVHTAINHYHKEQAYRKRTEALENPDEIGRQEEVLSGISFREILSLVQELTPAYRTVFNLYVIEGYKHKEIAGMLSISVGTSKSNLFKAKQHLQSKLESHLLQVKRYEGS